MLEGMNCLHLKFQINILKNKKFIRTLATLAEKTKEKKQDPKI